MCLLTSQRIPFIAKKDLTVFKVLHKNKNGKYLTPWQGMYIKFNTLLHTNYQLGLRETNGYSYGKYFLHSYLYVNDNRGDETFKAIIPKGSIYFISYDLTEICSNQLIITDIKVSEKEYYELYSSLSEHSPLNNLNDIFLPILETFNTKEVSIGWLMRENGTFINPIFCKNTLVSLNKDFIEDERIIGIVGAIKDNKKYIISLKEIICNSQFQSIQQIIPNADDLARVFTNTLCLNIILKYVLRNKCFKDKYVCLERVSYNNRNYYRYRHMIPYNQRCVRQICHDIYHVYSILIK